MRGGKEEEDEVMSILVIIAKSLNPRREFEYERRVRIREEEERKDHGREKLKGLHKIKSRVFLGDMKMLKKSRIWN